MAEAPLGKIATLSYLSRRMGRWQTRGVVAALAATVGGFVHQVYRYFTADPLLDGGVTWNETISWQAMTAGLAFLVAFILFFWVRSFIKWGLGIILLLVTGAGVVSYLTGMNIDLSKVQEGYASGTDWVWKQGRTLLGILTGHIPGAASAGAGAWLGFWRGKS